MKYLCKCGMFLKPVRYPKGKKPEGNNRHTSYKVLIVKTETHYKCPNGCVLDGINRKSNETAPNK